MRMWTVFSWLNIGSTRALLWKQ